MKTSEGGSQHAHVARGGPGFEGEAGFGLTRHAAADAVVGADGVHSVVRDALFGGAPTCIGPILDCLRAKSDFGYGVAEGE